MMSNKPAWMDVEQQRATNLATKGSTTNDTAPKLARITRAPSRKQKAFYIQDKHAIAFEQLVFDQKRASGRKAPELAEEAIELLLKKYNAKL